MSISVTTIQATDRISDSRSVINSNFSTLANSVPATVKHYVRFQAADSQNNNPTAGFNWTTSQNSLVNAASETGTNVVYGALPFPKSGSPVVQGNFNVTTDFLDGVGGIMCHLIWRSTGTGDAVWQVQGSLVHLGESLDPAWDTTTTGTGTCNNANTLCSTDIYISDEGLLEGAQGGQYFFNITRLTSNGSDNLSTSADLISVVFDLTLTLIYG